MTEWPLVGRGDELCSLWELTARAASGGVILAGSAGVGKTRLATECLQLAERESFATARVTATRSSATLPFGALAPILPAFNPGETEAADNRADLLRRSACALVERTDGQRLILLVDDAQFLDDASAMLVHQLAETRAAFVIATLRTGGAAPDPIVALWKNGVAERREIKGLPMESVEELLASVLGGQVDHAAVAHLAIRSQGNVLFLRELVSSAVDNGSLRNDGGIWRLIGSVAPSAALVELVETRFAGLEASERALLELVSFDEPLGSLELETLAATELAEDLEAKGLLSIRTDGRRLQIRLAHPVYADVLRVGIPTMRFRRIARSLAEVIESAGGRRREDSLRVATWRLTGGGGTPQLLLRGAFTARWRYDFGLAEQLAHAALEAGAGFSAALLAAQLVSLQGDGIAAEKQLAALAKRAADDDERAAVVNSRLDNSTFSLDLGGALAVAKQAEATISDPVTRDEIIARHSILVLMTEGPRAAAAAAEPLLRRATGKTRVWACFPTSWGMCRTGRLQAALRVAADGYATHSALAASFGWYPWMFLVVRCEAFLHLGRLQEAEALATKEYEQSLVDHSLEAQVLFGWQLSNVHRERGRPETAAKYGYEAAALARQLGRRLTERDAWQALALAFALLGRSQEASEALSTLDALQLPPSQHTGVDLLRARAWVCVATDNLNQAFEFLTEAARFGEAIGDVVTAAAALHDMARLGWAKDVANHIEEISGQIEGDLAAMRSAHVIALSVGDAAALERIAGEFEALGMDLLSAEAAVEAAVAWRRAAEPRKAAACERRAAETAKRCQGASTPTLRKVKARVRLTPTEQRAALLAAGGRSNIQIAEELGLAVRTVTNHLQHVYEKLGISSRRDLAAVLSTE